MDVRENLRLLRKREKFSPFNMALRTIERDRKNTLLIDVGDYIDIYFPGKKKVSMLIVGLSQGFYNMEDN